MKLSRPDLNLKIVHRLAEKLYGINLEEAHQNINIAYKILIKFFLCKTAYTYHSFVQNQDSLMIRIDLKY